MYNSNVQRSFSTEPGAQVTISAEITGIIDWLDQNYRWNDPLFGTGPINPLLPHSSYHIGNGYHPASSISGGVVSAEIPDPILLDKDNLSGSSSFLCRC